MDIGELVENAKKAEPRLARLSDEDAASLIAQTFRSILEQIESTQEGVVPVATLGRFQIRQRAREIAGRTVKRRVVNFRPARDE